MAGVSKSGGPNADINVVPLIDVVLVLLIIFMVVTPMLSKGVDVKLPKAENVVEKDERTTDDLVVAVKADGTLWVDTEEMSEEDLRITIQTVLRATPFRPVMVKGDERVSFGDVRKIVIMAQQAGAKVVNIATEAKKQKKAG